MSGSFSQLIWVEHSSAASSPLVSVLGIIGAQASLLHNFFHHLIPRFFSAVISSYVLELFLSLLFYLSLFHPFFQVASFKFKFAYLSLVSPRSFYNLSLLFYPLASHSVLHHEAFFHTLFYSFSFLLTAFIWCQPSSLSNIQIHNSSYFLHEIYVSDLSVSMTEFSHIRST